MDKKEIEAKIDKFLDSHPREISKKERAELVKDFVKAHANKKSNK